MRRSTPVARTPPTTSNMSPKRSSRRTNTPKQRRADTGSRRGAGPRRRARLRERAGPHGGHDLPLPFRRRNAVQKNVPGEDSTFTTRPPGTEFTLPDGREWEMVSPPDKHGGSIDPITHFGGEIQAAEDGEKITYVTTNPIDGEPPGNRGGLEPSQELATRGPGGWSNQDIASPNNHAGELGLGHGGEYRFFSPDLSLALVEPPSATPLAPPVAPGETQKEQCCGCAMTPPATLPRSRPRQTRRRGQR